MKTPYIHHSKPSPSLSTALSTIVPNLETWHHHLGHCNIKSIINMAKGKVSEGMQIDLSSHPAKCDHCALGKQSHVLVPKMQEGNKATEWLGRVYVNLCGLMAVTSCTGNLYSMNLINDFLGYVWTVPLHNKAEAYSALIVWHKAITTQSGNKLHILVTDNGELVSKPMSNWCNIKGIEHHTTVPHTSAHNGRAECLHKTIIGKGHSMCISCNAPAFLWDKFFATALYLTNLTATSANNGLTPFQLWFDHKPSLSHLCEIGCCAFSLHLPSPSKIYVCSSPCVLIGYAPHFKAYHLWNPSSSHVFNTYHVSFFEHLNSVPSPLLPGTMLGSDHTSLPLSWDVVGSSPPSIPSHSFPFSSFTEEQTLIHELLPSVSPPNTTTKNPTMSNSEAAPQQQQHMEKAPQEVEAPQQQQPQLVIRIPPPHARPPSCIPK